MNRTRIAIALAKAMGQTLTPELAATIARDIVDGPDLSQSPARFKPFPYGPYTFALESLRKILPELHELHVLHFTETESYRVAPLNPDYDAMAQSEHDGNLMQFTVRIDGQLVGCMRIYLTVTRHTQTITATEDGIFIRPEYRSGFLAVRFWQYVEHCLIEAGVPELFFLSKTSNQTDRLAKYLKYQPVGTLFSKCL